MRKAPNTQAAPRAFGNDRRFGLETFQTHISGAYWCIPGEEHWQFAEALVPDVTRAENSTQTCWFDELLEGGLKLPFRPNAPPLTMLLTGPPGTGKSTLALELSYAMARHHAWDTLYVSTEADAESIINHAESFLWLPDRFAEGNLTPVRPDKLQKGRVYIKSMREQKDLEDWRDKFVSVPGFRGILDSLSEAFGYSSHVSSHITDIHDQSRFEALVVDNLNTLPKDKDKWFSALAHLNPGLRLVLVILDSSSETDTANFWEYTSDNVIRLARDYSTGYMVRTIEIVKARFQKHAHGRHQLRVLSGKQACNTTSPSLRMREHPFRETGGIFIYPSMHFMLSRHKGMSSDTSSERITTPFAHLNRILDSHSPDKSGFLPGQCVAFCGRHGTHKSRLAHTVLLSHLLKHPMSRGLIISLRDNEDSTRMQLDSIMKSELANERQSLDGLCGSGRLEVAYYPPGFITPEEFFHRLQMSISRARTPSAGEDARREVLLVFNSLDLLESHFPLCARHPVFVTALIEFLGFENVTSFFIATDSEQDYGLRSMADPIIHFEYVPMRPSAYFARLDDQPRARVSKLDRYLVKMEITRFAGGTSAGKRCYLDLVKEGDPFRQYSTHAGLQVLPGDPFPVRGVQQPRSTGRKRKS